MAWLRTERAAVAHQLLAEGRDAVELATELGFSSLRHFHREMRQRQAKKPRK
jgi:AraC-like DNA-binding protein